MTLTCANCGFVNDMADETTTNCPNCGAPYETPTTYAAVAPTPPPPPAMSFEAPFASAPPATQNSRRGLLIGLGVAIVIVVLLAGGLIAYGAAKNHPAVAAVATVTPSPSASNATKVTFQTYSDPQGQFSVKYPSTWTPATTTTTIQSGSVNVTTLLAKSTKGATTGGAIIAVGGANLTLQNVGDILTANGLTGFTASGNPTTMTTKNGTDWQVVMGTATTAKGKSAKVAAAFAQHGANTYLVIGLSAGKGNSKVFAYMLKSMSLGTSA